MSGCRVPEVQGSVEALARALDSLAGMEPEELADRETLVELHRLCSRLDAVTTRAAAAFDASGDFALDGARSASAWLARRTRMPQPDCSRRVHLGRALHHLPAAEAAWMDGRIGAAQVGLLARARNETTAEALARDEDLLVGHARDLRFADFARAVAYWSHHADPDGTEEDDEARRNRRDAYLVRSISGMHFGRMTLDPISGEIVSGELARIEAELFEADWAEAKARLGRDPHADELARTAAQRRADALVEMAVRSTGAKGGRPVPLFSVLVDFPTFTGRVCELASGTVVSPGALLPWLTSADLERAVWRAPDRVDVSERARLFTGATRRAIELRDRCCTHPYCDAPVERCQVDHIIPYAFGGPTTQDNGRLLCGFHNRARNKRPPPDG